MIFFYEYLSEMLYHSYTIFRKYGKYSNKNFLLSNFSARVSESGSDYSDLDNEDYKQLMEAFPGACALEVSHCLTLMSGDMEGAAQLILHRQESGQSLQPNDLKSRCLGGGGGVISKNGRKFKEVDDKSVKNRIMNSYGFVDQAEDMRYHRPTLKREVYNRKIPISRNI